MLTSHLLGIATLLGLLVGWVAVQRAWRRAFPEACTDPDGLAGRMGCRGTCEQRDCARRSSKGADALEEDLS